MDIQKEREAFEKQGNIRIFVKQCLFDEQLNEYSSKTLHDYTLGFINGAWWAWQAAQAVPEGFVLVPKELSRYDAEVEAEKAWNLHIKHYKYEYRDMTGLQVAEIKNHWIERRTMRNQQEYKNFLGIITDSGKEV